MARRKPEASSDVYSSTARQFHWVTVALIAVLVPIGFIMADRGARDIWDATTNNLYSTHKLLGFTVLLLAIWRLTYRARHGAPADEPTLEIWQRIASHATHWAIYGLLLLVPLLGWTGVSMYPALDIFGLFKLPAITGKSELANQVLTLHKTMAWALVALIAVHVGAALFHYFIRKDGVLRRMLPGIGRKS